MMSRVENRLQDYIKKYSKTYNISPEEAVKHKIVQEVKKYYEEEEGGLQCEL